MGKEFIKEEKIRFQHCDYAGIVFYPRYFVMLNDLVEDWFAEELGFPFEKMHPFSGVPTVNINIDFVKPARLGDRIFKTLANVEVGGKSLKYQFKFTLDDHVLLKGHATLVFIHKDQETGQLKSAPWPEHIKTKLIEWV